MTVRTPILLQDRRLTLLSAVENLVDRDLINFKGGDHYEEVLNAISEARGLV